MRSMPGVGGETRVGGKRQPLMEIRGMVPLLHDLPPGCAFAGRCPMATDTCRAAIPPLVEYQPGHWSACWYAERAQELLHV
jgi:oligopeptide/dipeptide ABC transporter ATP-binding protein